MEEADQGHRQPEENKMEEKCTKHQVEEWLSCALIHGSSWCTDGSFLEEKGMEHQRTGE